MITPGHLCYGVSTPWRQVKPTHPEAGMKGGGKVGGSWNTFVAPNDHLCQLADPDLPSASAFIQPPWMSINYSHHRIIHKPRGPTTMQLWTEKAIFPNPWTHILFAAFIGRSSGYTANIKWSPIIIGNLVTNSWFPRTVIVLGRKFPPEIIGGRHGRSRRGRGVLWCPACAACSHQHRQPAFIRLLRPRGRFHLNGTSQATCSALTGSSPN